MRAGAGLFSSYPAAGFTGVSLCLHGTLTVWQRRAIHVGDRLVAVGFTLSQMGRKYQTAAALLDGNGVVIGQSEAIWIALA